MRFTISESEKREILNMYYLTEGFSGEEHEGYSSMSACKKDIPYNVVTKAGLSWKKVRQEYGSSGTHSENTELRNKFCEGWRPGDSKTEGKKNTHKEKPEPLVKPEDDEEEVEDFPETKTSKPSSSSSTKNKEVDDLISRMSKKYNLKITADHIQKELDQEGTTREDGGGINKEAESSVLKLIKFCRGKYSNEIGSVQNIVSHYRSYTSQIDNFGKKAQSRGVDDTQKWNALPGFSQHHTGKAFDIFSTDPEWWNSRPNVKSCIRNNASKYNLEVTYTESTTRGKVRGPEPWHLFYIG
jgi:LAS superfamily LD-carboxypeptidase LdcB